MLMSSYATTLSFIITCSAQQFSLLIPLAFFFFFFFSSRRRHTRSVSAFLLNRSSDLQEMQQQDNHEYPFLYQRQTCHQVQPNQATYQKRQKCQPATYLQEVLYQL